MKPCCVEYIAELDRCDAEWRAFMTDDPYQRTSLRVEDPAVFYQGLIDDNETLRSQIRAGTYGEQYGEPDQSCPWDPKYFHGVFADSYKALTKFWAAGGDMNDLTFGPIEVLREEVSA